MNWKLLLAVIIAIGITGLLLFSKNGEELKEGNLGRYITTIGSYLRRVTGEITSTTSVNRTLSLKITTTKTALKNLNFNLEGKSFEGKLKYDSVLVGGQNIKAKSSDEINIKIENINGILSFDENGKMKISGTSATIEVSDIIFVPETGEEKVEFDLIGTPITYSLKDIEKDELTFTEIYGLLNLADWSPLSLVNDNLDVIYFKGEITQDNDAVTISGMAERVRLNGVDLSLNKS